jgi:hypothetical protein
MSEEQTVFVNGIPELYAHLKKLGKGAEMQIKDNLKEYLKKTFEIDLDKKVDRWLEIPGGLKPIEYEYFKLYWELMQLYTNGLFYSAVVLGGVLSERICYDILSKQNISLKDNGQLTKEQISYLFKLNLRDIIEVLTQWKLIKDDTRILMIQVNDKRNSYVHPTKTEKVDAEKDAKEIVEKVSQIISKEFPVEMMK